MRISVSAALLCAFLAPVMLGAAAPGANSSPAPASEATAPPEIYHVSVRPLCSALRTKVAPSIGMILQNDKMISKGSDYFKQYADAAFSQGEGTKQMALYHMQNLVLPLANNILAVQKLLNDPSVFPAVASDDQDKRKLELKKQVLQSLAQQQASLDILNGFVETQNMADMQHEGFGYIRQMVGSDQVSKPGQVDPLANIAPTADPQGRPSVFDDTAINAGLPPNPYEIDLSRLPGLTVGFNPLNALREGVTYTQQAGKKAQDTLAHTVNQTVEICKTGQLAPAPASTP